MDKLGVIKKIQVVPLDKAAEIDAHLDDLTKPQGSLGQLESIAKSVALIQNTTTPQLPKKRIYTFAADHGVTAENVSAFPKEVTYQMVQNMLQGGAAVNVLGRHAGAEVRIVDIGVDAPMEGMIGVIGKKIKRGTSNMVIGPAMTTEETDAALQVGIELAEQAVDDGFTLLGIGEMGIGNTTAAAAIMHVLLPCGIDEIVGAGTGIDKKGIDRKSSVIERAIRINDVHAESPLDVLAKIGGLEIAGMTGLILGAAKAKVGVVVDGFIASAAALVALRLCPSVKAYLFFSHCSAEKGHKQFFASIKRTPILDLGMRLGEGTGAALAMLIIDASVKIYNEMATFSSAQVSGERVAATDGMDA